MNGGYCSERPRNRTKIDWWAWRSKGTLAANVEALSWAFGHPVTLDSRPGGYMGFESSARLVVGDMHAGLIAYGGDNQKGWSYVSVDAAGCSWVPDWETAQEGAADCKGYQVRRVDIALDLFDGSSTFDKTLEAYRAGGFSPPGVGRPPKCEPMKPERDQDSAIIRIGNRASNKYLRGYEKGKQLLGPALSAALDSEDRDPADILMAQTALEAPDGSRVSVNMWDWWRLELELKSKTTELPEDVIDRRDQYFAGAYPYLGQLLQDVDSQALIMRRAKGPQLDLALALHAIRRQYGATLFTALVAHHGDIGAVWSRIVGAKHNERLVKAGVLMVDHED